MKRTIFVVLAGAAACGSSGTPETNVDFPAAALMTVPGAQGHVQVAIRSSPQPPGLGLSAFEFTVTDMSGTPVEGAQVSVLPWMPSMGHGAPVSPVITSMGAGVFQITNVDLFMQGEWELRTSISGSVADSVDPEFQIQ